MYINNDNFVPLAIQNYQGNFSTGMEEFDDDLKRLHYIKRLLKKYERTGEIPERLTLNHFIILYNTFGSFGNTMLWHRMPELSCYMKPFSQFLNMLPPVIHINGREIITHNIEDDARLTELLKGI